MDEELMPWPFWKRVLLRFFLLFFLVFIFVYSGGLAAGQSFYEFYIQPFQNTAVWVGRRFFDLSTINFDGKGSGDTSGDYLLLVVIGSLALTGTIIWSAIERKRKNYDQLFYWLVVIIRCFLITIMTVYGLVKFFKTQFPYPSATLLRETYGQSSPMELAWAFFGYSKAYNYVMGFAEISCALLLSFRRTTLLGGLLTLVVAGNIMAINYCFDVPVKILSTALVAMSIFIIARDAKRLLSFFFYNRLTPPDAIKPLLFKIKWKRNTFTFVKYLLLIVFFSYNVFNLHLASQQNGNQPPDILSGYYNITKMDISKLRLAKDDSVKLNWDAMIISDNEINIKLPDQKELSFPYKKDLENHKLMLYKDALSKPFCEFLYQYIEPDVLLLNGHMDNSKISLKLELNDWEKTRLIRRGFHWINEYPYNL
jgi:hypothetical protein